MMFQREEVGFDTEEFHDVAELFSSHNKTREHYLVLNRVERVYNASIKAKFDQKMESYKLKYGHVGIYQLFHGTKSVNVPSILAQNLDHRRHGVSVGHRFGAGVSFSAQASYASHYSDEGTVGQMLLCDVLISNITNVPERKDGSVLLEPPRIRGSPHLRYDTTAKNKEVMDVVVKWEDHEFYPMYVVHFCRSARLSDDDTFDENDDYYDDAGDDAGDSYYEEEDDEDYDGQYEYEYEDDDEDDDGYEDEDDDMGDGYAYYSSIEDTNPYGFYDDDDDFYYGYGEFYS